MNWRKSSYSSGNGGECVEVASPAGAVAVRDTRQNGTGPVLVFTPAAWRRFAGQLKRSLASGLRPHRSGGGARSLRPVNTNQVTSQVMSAGAAAVGRIEGGTCRPRAGRMPDGRARARPVRHLWSGTSVPDGHLADPHDDQDHRDRQVRAQDGQADLAAGAHDRLGQHVQRRHPPGLAVTAVYLD